MCLYQLHCLFKVPWPITRQHGTVPTFISMQQQGSLTSPNVKSCCWLWSNI